MPNFIIRIQYPNRAHAQHAWVDKYDFDIILLDSYALCKSLGHLQGCREL